MEKKYYYHMNTFVIGVLPVILFILLEVFTYVIAGDLSPMNDTLMFLSYLPYLFLHEIIHSIGYVVMGADFKYVTYGIHIEKGVLCCSCKQKISKKCVLFSLILPFITIGVITYIIGIIFDLPTLVFLSILNISGCSVDLTMFLDFLTIKDFKYFEYDNPTAFGIITKTDMTKHKMLGLKMVEEKDDTSTIDKKVSISKASIIIIAVIVIGAILCMFI